MGSSPNGPGSGEPAEGNPAPPWKPILPFTRAVLYLGAFLVFLAGFQLYILTSRTDHWFAWTIAVPITAAFLSAFYWGSMPLALFSARQRHWALARVGMFGVAVFLWATLATTLLHLDKFHFDSTDAVAKGAAWLWLVIYAADPPLVTIALVMQMRAPGDDPPRTSPLQGWVKAFFAAQAVVTLGIGLALFAFPDWVGGWWPWMLTPLTGRAMASWLLGLAVVLVTTLRENDWMRIRVAILTFVLLAALQLLALVRYTDDVQGGVAAVTMYIVFWATALALGLYGSFKTLRESRSLAPTTGRESVATVR